MGVIIPQVVTSDRASGAQVIDGSLKFNDDDKQFLERTPSSAGNRRTWTWSAWVKRDNFGSDHRLFASDADANNQGGFKFIGDQIQLFFRTSGSFDANLYTEAVLRDTGWYHLMVAIDTTQATSTDRVKIYVNGALQSIDSSYNTYPSQNYDTRINNNVEHVIGVYKSNDSQYMNGAMSQVYFIDGQQLAPTEFGFTDGLTNTWKPKKYEGTFGTNGFYLPMDGNSPIGEDKSGNSNINDGTIWSNDVTTSNGYSANRDPSKGFDGNSSFVGQSDTYVQSDNSSGTVTWTPNGYTIDTADEILVKGISSVDRLSVVGSLGSQSDIAPATVNGVTNVYTIPTNLGTLTSLTVTGNSSLAGWSGISVGGILLVDGLKGNSWTPVNFGGSLELDNPQVSGARPILNTTQGGSQATVGVFGSRQNVGYAVTVYDDGGGNKYYIDGVKQATLTGLIRGATYTFDTSDSTVSSHPFRFSTTTQEGGGSATLYSNGVAAITGTATTITVPHDAPNTLYYYCTSHSGMGADITGITTNEKLADQYASHCTLALPLVSDDDDVCASIACTANNKTPTNSSVTAATTHSNFYSGSHYWSANSDTLQYAEQGNELVFGSGDYTIECWLYDDNGHNGTNNRCYIFDNRIGGSVVGDPPTMTGYIDSHNEFNFGDGTNTITHTVPSTVGKWWHYAVTREGTTTRMFIDGILRGSATSSTNFTNNGIGVGRATDANYGFAGYIQDFRVYTGIAKYTSNFVVPSPSPDILPDTPSGVSGSSKLTISPDTSTEGAVVFDGDSDYLSSTGPGTLAASSNWCMECTFYCTGDASGTYRIMGANESSESSEYLQMRIRLGQYQFYTENANTLTGTAAFKKWTHMALTKSGTTVRAFVDGKQLWSTTDNNADDITTLITGWGYGSEYFPGFISNARFVNGSSVYTSEFNPPVVPLTNITNTTHLFCQSNTSATAAAVGTITANGTAAASRFTPFNTDINTVRGQETGYATLNPLKVNSSSSIVLSDGNLRVDITGNYYNAVSTLGMSSGKFYCETSPVRGYSYFGIATGDVVTNTWGGDQTNNTAWVLHTNGSIYHNNATTNGTGFPTPGTSGGYVLGLLFDADNKTMRYVDNGVISKVYNMANTVDGDSYYFFVGGDAGSYEIDVNFGQKPFKFPPPDGFQPLNDANTRPTTVIARPDQYVGVTTYKGNNTVGRIIDIGRNADLVWVKKRTAENHILVDTVRGANNFLMSDSTNTANTSGGPITGIGATVYNGFIVDNNGYVNGNNSDYVCWNWKAGGDKNTFNVDDVGYASAAAAGLDGGTLTPSGASIGTKQGFSIIQWEGTNNNKTISHGLSQTPEFIINKNIDTSSDWYVGSSYLGTGNWLPYLVLNSTAGEANNSDVWQQGGVPNATTFGVGAVGNSTGTHIAYLWHDVPGLQKFGSYTSNNSADGPFIELGFRPAILWFKNTSGTSNWAVYDTTRSTFNISNDRIRLNTNDAEGNVERVDILSNGFKIRSTSFPNATDTTTTFIYCAWAEAPTVDLFGGGANAR